MALCSEIHDGLGNQLFAYASMIGTAGKNTPPLLFPLLPPEVFNVQPSYINYTFSTGFFSTRKKETDDLSFHNSPYYLDQIKEWNRSVPGCWPSENFWKHDRQRVLETLEFKEAFKISLKEKYRMLFDKSTVAIYIRCGEADGPRGVERLPVSFYYLALLEHFSDWQNQNLLIISDDPENCFVHFECLPNATIIRDTPVNMLCLGSMCENFILANSTFSWWMAYLAQGGTVIRPAGHLALNDCNDKDSGDYYPGEWIQFDHKGKKLSMEDFTFIIPVKYDHPDRKQNLDLCVTILKKDILCEIIIGEIGNTFDYWASQCRYVQFDYKDFHRTRMLNAMAKISTTPFIVIYDSDICLPPLQLYIMAHKLRSNADMVFPFTGEAAKMRRSDWFNKFNRHLDCGIVRNARFWGREGKDPGFLAVGHAAGINKRSFFNAGGENENFISWGPEDIERYKRFKLLDYKIERVAGAMYHMNHWKGPDSSTKNPFFIKNCAEAERLDKMNKDELKKEIQTWGWINS